MYLSPVRYLIPPSRSDGPAGDAVPGAGEHLQHGDDEHAQGGGPHRHRGMDARLHPLRLRRPHRVRGNTLQVSTGPGINVCKT